MDDKKKPSRKPDWTLHQMLIILPKRRTHSDTDKAQRNRAISATKNDAAPKTADTTATTMEITVTL